MIPARADKKVCPVFCVCVPVSMLRGARFFCKFISDKGISFVHISSFFQSIRIFLLFMETTPALFPSSTV